VPGLVISRLDLSTWKAIVHENGSVELIAECTVILIRPATLNSYFRKKRIIMTRILVIYYEQDQLIDISSSLRKLIPDSLVMTANSGTEGLKKAKIDFPDIILLPTEIGETSGFEVCETLRSGEATKYIPVIMLMKSTAGPESRVRALQCGASALLPMPIYKPELLAQFNAVLRIKKAEEENRELEAMLQQARRMEAIGTLAGGIAHDFNNILTIIIGYTELALADASRGTRAYDNFQEVIRAGRRGRDLVKQLLTFSRQREHERDPLQISVILKEVLKMLGASMPASIEISKNIQTDSGKVLGDPSQIHQMLMNLFTNTAHALSEGGGDLEVSLSDVDIDAGVTAQNPDLKPGPHVRLRVSVSGRGISPSIIERIFNPYITTKGEVDGTGMGPTIVVRGTVKSHGGGIIVHSKPGNKATLDIFFPRIRSEVTSKKELATSLPRGKERILLIDDEQALASLGKQMLERLGYQVISETSSMEALKGFRAQPHGFDLVITDVIMPSMTGLELAEKLLTVRPDIPIILCSGVGETVTKEKARALGIREFVMKPIVITEIAKIIRKVLDQENHRGTDDNSGE
jgi:signal transduction histidine kinase